LVLKHKDILKIPEGIDENEKATGGTYKIVKRR
jgi:hypothetical protein